MSTMSSLLAEIEAFLAETGMKKTVFGRVVLNDGAFVKRLQDGGGVTVSTADRVRSYIETQRTRPTQAQPSEAA